MLRHLTNKTETGRGSMKCEVPHLMRQQFHRTHHVPRIMRQWFHGKKIWDTSPHEAAISYCLASSNGWGKPISNCLILWGGEKGGTFSKSVAANIASVLFLVFYVCGMGDVWIVAGAVGLVVVVTGVAGSTLYPWAPSSESGCSVIFWDGLLLSTVMSPMGFVMACSSVFFDFLSKLKVAFFSSPLTADICCVRVNVDMIQYCGNRTYDQDICIDRVSVTVKMLQWEWSMDGTQYHTPNLLGPQEVLVTASMYISVHRLYVPIILVLINRNPAIPYVDKTRKNKSTE